MNTPTPSPTPTALSNVDPTSWPDAAIIIAFIVCVTVGAIFFFKYLMGD